MCRYAICMGHAGVEALSFVSDDALIAAYDNLGTKKGRDWKKVLAHVGLPDAFQNDDQTLEALVNRLVGMGATVRTISNGKLETAILRSVLGHERGTSTPEKKAKTVISWPVKSRRRSCHTRLKETVVINDVVAASGEDDEEAPRLPMCENEDEGLHNTYALAEWVQGLVACNASSSTHRGDARVSEDDIVCHSLSGRVPMEEDDGPLDAMEAHYEQLLHSILTEEVGGHGTEDDDSLYKALDDLFKVASCRTEGGVDLNKVIREDDPHGITVREVAYFLLKHKIETGSSWEQGERLARVCKLLNGGVDSACPYTVHQLERILEVENATTFLVHVCPKYCKVFDMEKDGDDEGEVCGVDGCLERRYHVRALAHGGKRLIPRDFIIHFGLHRALKRWFSMPEFWALRAQPEARSQLDFWTGALVKRLDGFCGGRVLHEEAKAVPCSGELMLERHGCCLNLGTDHFPVFQNRKRYVFS